MFAIANHLLALPVSAIFKVVQCSSSLRESIQNKELILFDNHPLTLLDLYPLLTQTSQPEQERSLDQCLVIAQAYGNLYAIPVNQPPTLQDLILTEIHPLPATYNRAIASLVSHFAIVNQADKTLKILLLDLYQVAQ